MVVVVKNIKKVRYNNEVNSDDFNRVYRIEPERPLEWRKKQSEAHKENHIKNKGICRRCKRTITEEEAVKWVLKKNQWECYDCERKRGKEKRLKYKIELINHYGNKCECCGESQIEFLTIDHIGSDGHLQRKDYLQKFGKQLNYYNWLRQNGFPKDNYRILCYNCNCARAFNNGICPHQNNKNNISILSMGVISSS